MPPNRNDTIGMNPKYWFAIYLAELFSKLLAKQATGDRFEDID
jgi:hypothetical protein